MEVEWLDCVFMCVLWLVLPKTNGGRRYATRLRRGLRGGLGPLLHEGGAVNKSRDLRPDGVRGGLISPFGEVALYKGSGGWQYH